MATIKNDPLFDLIKSLSKSEKRHFKIFANRTGNSEDLKFIKLFEAMDFQKTYDDVALLQKVSSIKKVQFSNQKANLYKHILASLRQYHTGHNLDMQLRENLDYAKVLYDKGFYKQALKLLEKSKVQANSNRFHTIGLEILEFEKLIESQYITRSIATKAEELTKEIDASTSVIASAHQLSNLALNLYGLYLKKGYVRNEEDFNEIKTFFLNRMPNVVVDKLSFYEELYYHQSYVWYNYIIQDFANCYRHSLYWTDLFRKDKLMLKKHPEQYIKGLHNLLSSLFHLQHYSKFCAVMEELEALSKNIEFTSNLNTEILIFKFLYTAKINKLFMEGRFDLGIAIVPELLDKLAHYKGKIDAERVLMFYYKIASLYFGNRDYRKAIYYLNQIIDFKDVTLREDIHCFARILNLIAHYEEGEDNRLEYQIKSTYHFLGRMNDQRAVQKEIFNFIRKVDRMTPDSVKDEFKALHGRLTVLKKDIYEKRPFLYLDILTWLESKFENRTTLEIAQEKFKSLK
jgi:TPR repeat protein